MNATTTDAGGTPSPPPPSSPPPPPRPPLRRDAHAGLVGGVAAGVANHLGIDVVLVRIGFVIVTIFTQGLGAIAYLFGWVFISPAEGGVSTGPVVYPPSAAGAGGPSAATYASSAPGQPQRPAPSSEQRRGPSFWFGVALLTLGAIWFLGAVTGPGRIFGWVDAGVVIPLLLVGLGVALWRRSERPPAGPVPGAGSGVVPAAARTPGGPAHQAGSPPPPPSEPSHPATDGVRNPDAPEDQETTTMPAAPPTTAPPGVTGPPRPGGPESLPPSTGHGGLPPLPPRPGTADDGNFTPPPVPTRERSILTRLVLGLALLTAGVLWMLEIADITAIGPLRITAIVLGLIGIGLLVGSVVGRGRLLILFGILLVPAVLVGSVLRGFPALDLAWDVGSGRDIGQMNEQPVGVDDLRPLYRLGAGELELDLSDLDLDPGSDAETRIEMGAGEVVVIVPRDVDVVVDGRMAAGELDVFDQRRAGVGVTLEVTDSADAARPSGATSDDPAELLIDLSVGFGDVTIERTDR